jgi:polyhydroxybutyrate depolymerase
LHKVAARQSKPRGDTALIIAKMAAAVEECSSNSTFVRAAGCLSEDPRFRRWSGFAREKYFRKFEAERLGRFLDHESALAVALLAMAEGMIVRSRLVSFIAAAGGRAGCVARRLILALIASAAIAGPPEAAVAASGRISIESGGVTRSAILVQHHRLKQARRPLVIVVRSSKEKGPHLKRIFGLEEMTNSAGPILIYPEPIAGRWSDAPGPEAVRDTAFIRDVIAKLVADGVVDRRKVFLIGISNGGLAALRIACDNAPLFAGVAALITSLPADLAATCKPSHALPLMMIAGTTDAAIPYNGGRANLPGSKVDVLSVDATLAIFGRAAACGEGHTTTPFPDRDPRDGTRVYLDKLNGCKVPVELLRVEGGGHSIPGHWAGSGSEAGRGLHNNDVESAKLIWEFFRRLGG